MSAPRDPIPAPSIRKAQRVIGKTLVFRDATAEDADFILSLRTDVDGSQCRDVKLWASTEACHPWHWIPASCRNDGMGGVMIKAQSADQPIGTVRLYDARDQSFCWGSWILHDSRPSHAAMESALMVYAYAVDHLGFTAAHFDVRKGNERVWRFHERFGASTTARTRSATISTAPTTASMSAP